MHQFTSCRKCWKSISYEADCKRNQIILQNTAKRNAKEAVLSCNLWHIGKQEKAGLKTIMPLVELSAGGIASELMKITLIFTENAKFPIKKGYLRVN